VEADRCRELQWTNRRFGKNFTLAFNTLAGTVSLTEVGGDASTLIDTITGTPTISGGTDTSVDFHANWVSLPLDFQLFLGSATGTDVAITSFLTSTGRWRVFDVNIQPTPEPSSLLLLGTACWVWTGNQPPGHWRVEPVPLTQP